MMMVIFSILAGITLGLVYGFTFLGPIAKNDNSSKFNLMHVISSFFRLVFVTVAIIAAVIYIKLNFIWLLCGFMGAFWGTILSKTRAKR
jgi:hypothetical protein